MPTKRGGEEASIVIAEFENIGARIGFHKALAATPSGKFQVKHSGNEAEIYVNEGKPPWLRDLDRALSQTIRAIADWKGDEGKKMVVPFWKAKCRGGCAKGCAKAHIARSVEAKGEIIVVQDLDGEFSWRNGAAKEACADKITKGGEGRSRR